jgi:hypothetical protein
MKMKTLVVTFFLGCFLTTVFAATPAQANVYHRFWRGQKRADLSVNQFTQSLGSVFIPATVKVGVGKGLLAYEPVLTTGILSAVDEIALVSYESESAYQSLFATAAGKAYQNLHWQYFDRPTSSSVEPISYAGEVMSGGAYDFHPSYAGWRTNNTEVLIYFRVTSETATDFLNRANQHFKCLASDANVTIPLQKETATNVQIGSGQGINLQF